MFAKSGVIKSYSTIKTADKAFGRDRYWQEAFPEERMLLLDEYTSKLRRDEEVKSSYSRAKSFAHKKTK